MPPSGDGRGQFVALPLREGPDRIPGDAEAPRVAVQRCPIVVARFVEGVDDPETVRPARAGACELLRLGDEELGED